MEINGMRFLILHKNLIYTDYPNTEQFDKDLAQFKESVPQYSYK